MLASCMRNWDFLADWAGQNLKPGLSRQKRDVWYAYGWVIFVFVESRVDASHIRVRDIQKFSSRVTKTVKSLLDIG